MRPAATTGFSALAGPPSFSSTCIRPDGHLAAQPSVEVATPACSAANPARVLSADPPWRFGDKLPGAGRGAERHCSTVSVEEPNGIVNPARAGLEPGVGENEAGNFATGRSTTKRRIEVGDLVVAKQPRAEDARVLYGDRAGEPFIVEGIDKTRGQLAVRGGGMLFWSSDVSRLRTRHQLECDARERERRP